MVKVLYIITKNDIGGAQKYTNDLVANLDKNKFEAKILHGGKEIKWLSNKTLPWFLFLNDWLAIAELVRIYKKERPGVIHLNSSKAGVIGSFAAKIYKVACRVSHVTCPKVIFTAHGWVFNPTNDLSMPIRWFYFLIHKLAALFQDKIICVSEYDHKLALQYNIAPKNKLITIHNGISPNIKFLNKETARKELIKGIGYRVRGLENFNKSLTPNPSTLNPNLPWIGSIGRLVKEKNYETFIHAATLIPDTYFFLIGEGPKYENYKLQITNYKLQNRFFIIKPTGNDYEYLKAFNIFVMSSIKEGLPYILLEAMSAELPIVVTEAGGMPEIIKNHENGLMVAQKNPEMLANAIQGLIKNKNIANELKITAKKIVLEKFGLKQMIEKTSSVYLSLNYETVLICHPRA